MATVPALLPGLVFIAVGTALAANIRGFADYDWQPRRRAWPLIDFTDVLNERLTAAARERILRIAGIVVCVFGGSGLGAALAGEGNSGVVRAPELAGAAVGALWGIVAMRLTGPHRQKAVAVVEIGGAIKRTLTSRTVREVWTKDPVNGLSVLEFSLPGRGTLSVWLSSVADGSYPAAESMSHAEFIVSDHACNSEGGTITVEQGGAGGRVSGRYRDVNDPAVAGEWSARWRVGSAKLQSAL